MRFQHLVQRAGMAQRRSRQAMRRRLVARRYGRQRVECHVKRRILGQHRLQQRKGGFSRGISHKFSISEAWWS
jgi:hypothetical protein